MTYSDPTIPQPPQYDIFGKIDEINRRLEAMEHHEHTALPPNALQLGGSTGLPCDAVGTSGSSPYAAHDDHSHASQFPLGVALPQSVNVTTSTAGSATAASREDHVHFGVATLSNAAPATVAGIAGAGASNAAARGDHVHIGALVGSATPLPVQASAVVGVSGNASREDHRHAGLLMNSYYALGSGGYGDIFNSVGSGFGQVIGVTNLSGPGAGNSLVIVTGTFEFEQTSGAPFGFGWLFVDGAQRPSAASYRTTGGRATVSQTWQLSMAAGPHSYILNVSATAAGMSYLGGNSSLSILMLG